MKKHTLRFLSFFLLMTLLFSLFGCGSVKEDVREDVKEELQEDVQEAASERSFAVVDQAGRSVEFEREAERVVSCYYVTTYAMLSLGAGDLLVGIEKKADTRPIYAMAYPSLLDLPAVGSLKEIDCEKIASLSPDLVILPKKLTDSAEVLESLGIKTLIVNPESEDALFDMLTLLGKVCGKTEEPNELIVYSDAKKADFTASGETPSVLFCGNSSYLTAAPGAMYQSDLITRAGGVNVFADSTETYWTELSYETLLTLNPDYIVIPSGASYTADDLCADSVLAGLDCVKEERVVTIPNTFEEWDSPIPSAVLGVLWLRSILHPSDYTIESFRKDTAEFYETFYGFTPDGELLDALR